MCFNRIGTILSSKKESVPGSSCRGGEEIFAALPKVVPVAVDVLLCFFAVFCVVFACRPSFGCAGGGGEQARLCTCHTLAAHRGLQKETNLHSRHRNFATSVQHTAHLSLISTSVAVACTTADDAEVGGVALECGFALLVVVSRRVALL